MSIAAAMAMSRAEREAAAISLLERLRPKFRRDRDFEAACERVHTESGFALSVLSRSCDQTRGWLSGASLSSPPAAAAAAVLSPSLSQSAAPVGVAGPRSQLPPVADVEASEVELEEVSSADRVAAQLEVALAALQTLNLSADEFEECAYALRESPIRATYADDPKLMVGLIRLVAERRIVWDSLMYSAKRWMSKPAAPAASAAASSLPTPPAAEADPEAAELEEEEVEPFIAATCKLRRKPI